MASSGFQIHGAHSLPFPGAPLLTSAGRGRSHCSGMLNTISIIDKSHQASVPCGMRLQLLLLCGYGAAMPLKSRYKGIVETKTLLAIDAFFNEVCGRFSVIFDTSW